MQEGHIRTGIGGDFCHGYPFGEVFKNSHQIRTFKKKRSAFVVFALNLEWYSPV